jgi:hypothetical protein
MPRHHQTGSIPMSKPLTRADPLCAVARWGLAGNAVPEESLGRLRDGSAASNWALARSWDSRPG